MSITEDTNEIDALLEQGEQRLSVLQAMKNKRARVAERKLKTPKEAYGKKIESVDEVCRLAYESRSVICPNMWGVLPCAVVQNMQARLVAKCVESGLYIYIPKSERKQKTLDL